MATIRTYTNDLRIASAIIKKDEGITCDYFYKKCYPLFKSIYDNYYTDCETCFDFMNEIYILILTPSPKTGHCQLENYRGESSQMLRKNEQRLISLRFEGLVPTQTEKHHRSDCDKVKVRVVTPMVVFAHMTEDDSKSDKELYFIYVLSGMSCSSNRPILIFKFLIENFRLMFNQQEASVSILPTYNLKKGDKEQVVRGPNKDVTYNVYFASRGIEFCKEVDTIVYACFNSCENDLKLNKTEKILNWFKSTERQK